MLLAVQLHADEDLEESITGETRDLTQDTDGVIDGFSFKIRLVSELVELGRESVFQLQLNIALVGNVLWYFAKIVEDLTQVIVLSFGNVISVLGKKAGND